MRRLLLVSLALAALGACTQTGRCSRAQQEAEVRTDPLIPAQPVRPGEVPDSKLIGIAFLGDSITVGLGLTSEEAYPAEIGRLFVAEGYGEVEIENAGVSGDTTAGGRRRVEMLLQPTVKILVVALGGNDALRGISVSDTRANLKAIIDAALAKRVEVLLVGMEAPTNYGEDYRGPFRATFSDLAREYGTAIQFLPFLLEGVGGVAALNQADGIHPNVDGARVIASLLHPKLRDMVDQIANSIR